MVVVAHAGEAHLLTWWVPVVVLVAAVAGPMAGVGSERAEFERVSTTGDASMWWRRGSAVVGAVVCLVAVGLGARTGATKAMTWGVWAAAIPVAALLGPWVTWLSTGAPGEATPQPVSAATASRPGVRPGWAAVASLALLAWLSAALPGSGDAALLGLVLVAYAGAHLVAATWCGRQWWASSEGVRAATAVVAVGWLLPIATARAQLPRLTPRPLTAAEGALLAVATAAVSPMVLAALGDHGSAWPGVLGPRPVQAAVLLSIGVFAAVGVGWLAATGLAGGDRFVVLSALAAGWVVVGGVERLVPTWSGGTAGPVVVGAAAVVQLAAAGVAHVAAARRVSMGVTSPRYRLVAAGGLVISATVCGIVVGGL